MAEFPYLPLWTGAYLADTTHFRALEHGAYMLLLMAAWRIRDGGLPDDDEMLARYALCTKREWQRIRPLVMAPWVLCPDGKWRQPHLEKRRSEVALNREARSRSARARWLKNNDSGHAYAYPTHMQSESESKEEGREEEDSPAIAGEARAEVPADPGTAVAVDNPQQEMAASAADGGGDGQRPKGRGTRLPADWQPDTADIEFAGALGLDWRTVADQFRDYWHAKAANATKLDWKATWRVWCRKESGGAVRHGHGGGERAGERRGNSGVVASAVRVMRQRGLI